MDARRFNEVGGLPNITLKALIDWYCVGLGGAHRSPDELLQLACTRGNIALNFPPAPSHLALAEDWCRH
jgi:hypothetical protein